MITLSNYEDWFLLYADGELTVAEQKAVLQFVELHPSLKEELNEIMQLRFQPETAIKLDDHTTLRAEYFKELETTYCFEPDLSIQFPDKHKLYKRTAAPMVSLFRYAAVAASLIITVGLIWWSATDEFGDAPLVSNEMNTTEEVVSPIKTTMQATSTASKDVAKVRNLVRQVAIVATPKLAVVKTNEQQTTSSSITEEIIQDVAVTDLMEVPVVSNKVNTNLSKEVIEAAEARMNNVTPMTMPVSTALPINTAVLIESEMSTEKQVPVRGLFRKIARTIFGERKEDGDGQKYIQLAVFSIPVQQ